TRGVVVAEDRVAGVARHQVLLALEARVAAGVRGTRRVAGRGVDATAAHNRADDGTLGEVSREVERSLGSQRVRTRIGDRLGSLRRRDRVAGDRRGDAGAEVDVAVRV